MATPSEKLAESLLELKKIQDQGVKAIPSKSLSRIHRERLLKIGYLQEVVKGWYIPSRPDELPGDSTAWYTSFWEFCAQYLNARFGDEWCLSPEQSLFLHSGNQSVPRQLLIRSPKGSNKVTIFPYDTSLFVTRASMPAESDIEVLHGLRLYKLSNALIACSPQFFHQNPTDAQAALAGVKGASDLLRILLEGGHSVIAGRLAGALRNIGRSQIADDIVNTMRSVNYNVRETDPFAGAPKITLSAREFSPHVNRMRVLWQVMRKTVLASFPEIEPIKIDCASYLDNVDEIYVMDAYHSLSIEGYQVTHRLIQQVQEGNWDPNKVGADQDQKNALAARGYWQAFQAVKKSIEAVFAGQNPGAVADVNHRDWYTALFSPFVDAKIFKPYDLSGYRNHAVYIRRSMHVPPNEAIVRDLMPAFFDLLREELEPSVRVVLGHFFFVFIHPYMDGNGRMARFLMNVMMASVGCPWIIVQVEQRKAYFDALEAASARQDIQPFTQFIANLVIGER